MIYNNKNIVLSIIFTFILSLGCCFAEQVNQKGEKAGVVISKNKDAVVHVECVKTDTGLAVGFRIKIINPSSDKNLVLTMKDNSQNHFIVYLLNKRGLNISPRRKKAPRDGSNSSNYCMIHPRASQTWFIPIPNQVRIDTLKHNDKNLQTTPSGKYMARIKIIFGYFTQDKDKKDIEKSPKYKRYKVKLANIPVQIDSKSFNQDIEKIYKETKKK
jgi:hypothetical protein